MTTTISVDQAINLAFEHHQAGRLVEARAIYGKILTQNPNNANVLHLQGLVSYAEGEYDTAIKLISQAIAVAPNIPEFYNNLGEVLRAAGQYDAAVVNYQQALAFKPNYAEALNNLGNAWVAAGKVQAAQECYEKAIAAQPNYAEAHYNLGYVLAAQTKFTQAIPALEEATRLNPGFASAHYHLGNALRETGKLPQAIERFRAAIKYDPNFPDAYNNLGNLLLQPPQTRERLACYEKAIALQPNHVQANTTLGTLLLQSEHFDAAARCFERALTVDPDNAFIQHLLNAVRQQQVDRAPLAYIREVYDSYAQEFESHLTQGLSYRIPEELSELLRRHVAIPPQGLDIIDLGCGTGLGGVMLKDVAHTLIGVDASPKMLEKANERGIYNELICADMVMLLRELPIASKDLVWATDVFIYTGDLSEIFGYSAAALRLGGALAFSVESSGQHESDFALQLSGRYSHALPYVQRLAEEYGFDVSLVEATVIRTERGIPVPGYIFILRKIDEKNKVLR